MLIDSRHTPPSIIAQNQLSVKEDIDTTKSKAIYAFLAIIKDLLSTYTHLSAQSNQMLKVDIEDYRKKTESKMNHMYGQAAMKALTGVASGGCQIGSGFYKEKTLEQLTLTGASSIASILGNAGDAVINIPITQIDASTAILTQVNLQSDQTTTTNTNDQQRRTNELTLSIIEKSGRG